MMNKVRLDYYGITSTNDARGLLGEKMRAILDKVPEKDREVVVGTSYLNFDVKEDASTGCFVGHIRTLRMTLPQKGKIGSNCTEDLILNPDEGISEMTYFIYRYDIDKLVIQYNYHGPKVKDLVNAINKLYREKVVMGSRTPRCSFVPVILGSEIDLVMRSAHIMCIVAKSRTPVKDGDVSENAMFGDIVKYHNMPEETSVSLELKHKEGKLSDVFRSLVWDKSQIENYDKLEVELLNTETGKVEPYDLLKNKLVREVYVSVEDENPRKLDIRELLSKMNDDLCSCVEKYSWNEKR